MDKRELICPDNCHYLIKRGICNKYRKNKLEEYSWKKYTKCFECRNPINTGDNNNV